MAAIIRWIVERLDTRLRRAFAFIDANPPLRHDGGKLIDLSQLIGRARGPSK